MKLFRYLWCCLWHGGHQWQDTHIYEDGEVAYQTCRRCRLKHKGRYK